MRKLSDFCAVWRWLELRFGYCSGRIVTIRRMLISIARSFVPALIALMFSAISCSMAKGGQLNPPQLGTFCPPGSMLADGKNTQTLSLKEQEQIKRIVEGFLTLDAQYRRSGSPRGPSEFWKKGYTERFDDAKEVPIDAVEYIDARFQNVCAQGEGAISIVLLDVAEFGPRELPPMFQNRFLSPQNYWDGFRGTPVKPPSKNTSAIPTQPLIFIALPLIKGTDGHWVVNQSKVPILLKFRKSDWQRRIDQTNLFSCSQPKTSTQYSAERCAQMEKDKAILKQLDRPAWSVVRKDFLPASNHAN